AAATVEHRLFALICDPAQPDMGARLPAAFAHAGKPELADLERNLDDERREFLGARMVAHGVDSIGDYFATLREYNMLRLADQITCATLIIECEGDFAGGGGQALLDALQCPAELVQLTEAQGAGGHCAGIGQRVWDDTVFKFLHAAISARA